MSAPELVAIERRAGRAMQTYGTLVVCGGGCYGSYYVRQLLRAASAGALRWERLLVVDRDASCRVAGDGAALDTRALDDVLDGVLSETFGEAPREPTAEVAGDHGGVTGEGSEAGSAAGGGAPPRHQHGGDSDGDRSRSPAPRIFVSPWTDFFDAYLARGVADPVRVARDAVVPSPLMPHLMFEWLVRRAQGRWPGRAVATEPLPSTPPTPWHRHAESATYVSFAEWMCPINCIEPARCPETRGPRTWSVPSAIRAYVDERSAEEAPLAGPVLFHCTHRAYGVGMFDVADVIAADAVVRRAGDAGDARIVVGTVSHCHGALGVIRVGT